MPSCGDDGSGNADVADNNNVADDTDGESITIPPCCCLPGPTKTSSTV